MYIVRYEIRILYDMAGHQEIRSKGGGGERDSRTRTNEIGIIQSFNIILCKSRKMEKGRKEAEGEKEAEGRRSSSRTDKEGPRRDGPR